MKFSNDAKMAYIEIIQFKLKDYPERQFLVGKDEDGWYYFISSKLAEFYGKENIFGSIEELKLVLGYKVEEVKRYYS